MPGLHVYRSNRLETLAGSLADLIAAPAGRVLDPEIVVVQSLGMRRWLSLELAQRLGVTMNCRFPFPAAFARDVFRAAFGGDGENAGFDRDILPWRVLALFPRLLGAPGWETLHAYAQGEREALKQYQLARKIAAVFDRYLAFRPELLLAWQSGRNGAEWQAQLWRELVRDCGEDHPPALLRRLEARSESAPLEGLPARVAVFGISSLPPFYLNLIPLVARSLDLHLFLLEPTDQYWGDIESRREQDRRLAASDTTAEELHLDTGNPLLASHGKIGRDFTRVVQDLEPVSITEDFSPPTRATLLARVQADIFELCERRPAEREALPEVDGTIRVHCCHGPMREVEILYDQLLDLFERIPGLAPRDVLVAMPDVETYAPFIEAVFGCPEDDRLEIPFTIADRSARAENSVADTFLRLLDLHGGRFGAASVLALLEHPAVRRRFSLTETDLETIRHWIAAAHIRWGIDAEHRAGLGLPHFSDNTWRAGLDRLLLGYALPGDDRTLWEGILPLRDVEGAMAAALGNFVEFAETLFEFVPRLGAPRSLAEWAQFLRELVRAFFDDADESADEVRRVRDVLSALGTTGTTTACAMPLDFEIIRAHLGAALADTDSGVGFMAGRVTFCALKPMRAIPFKVICLIGMNDSDFPRRDTSLAFDLLTAGQPRRGDRSQRDDDRYLFLEAILSAREVLYLSYCGLSPRDNSEAPPSVVVSELLDYLEQNFTLPAGELRPAIVTRHRLQAFSPAYFTNASPLFSYSAENALSSEHARAARAPAPDFSATPLPEPGPEWRAVEVGQLAEFFANPAKFFLRERLRLAQPNEIEPLEESELTGFDSLVRYKLGQDLTQVALESGAIDQQRPVLRASGVLPYGYAGDSAFSELGEQATGLAETIRRVVPDPPLEPLPVAVESGPWRLTGVLRGVHASAQVRYRAANLKGKDFLRAWIYHLALQFSGDGPSQTLLFGRDEVWRFDAVPDAAARLADVLELFGEGLRAPLRLFPATSMEFARRTLLRGPRERADPVIEARKIWDGNSFNNHAGEREDPWIARCFPATNDPLDEAWQEIALRVFGPLFAARTEGPR